jgi:Asp/Glu/hydantoin racemase
MLSTLAFIHTSHVLIPTFADLARKHLGAAKIFNMVDESLIQNTIASGELTKATIRRLVNMIGSAHDGGADAVMVTCSSIGPAIPIARSVYNFPIFRIDDAMAAKAVQSADRIGVAATLKTTLEPTVGLLEEKASERHRSIRVVECLCNGAFEKVLAGDTEGHDQIVSQALTSLIGKVDVLVLAQASMARVVNQLPAGALNMPVLSSPELAIQQARELVFG